MDEAIKAIQKLIDETEGWIVWSRANHLPIDAAAGSIRLKALLDALKDVKKAKADGDR